MNTFERMYRRSSINKDTGCWEWGGAKNSRGYGAVEIKGKMVYTHRLAASLFLGFDLSSNLCVLHHCDNRLCWNPHHLFVGTQQDNTLDMIAKGRGICFGGAGNGYAKLTDEDVIDIRKLVLEGTTQIDVAKEFGITQANVSLIVLRKTWAHI